MQNKFHRYGRLYKFFQVGIGNTGDKLHQYGVRFEAAALEEVVFVEDLRALDNEGIKGVVDGALFGNYFGLKEEATFFPGNQLVNALRTTAIGGGGVEGLTFDEEDFCCAFIAGNLQSSGHFGQVDGLQERIDLHEGQIAVQHGGGAR